MKRIINRLESSDIDMTSLDDSDVKLSYLERLRIKELENIGFKGDIFSDCRKEDGDSEEIIASTV